MNKFPFNKYQGTAAKKKNRNKKPVNVFVQSKRPGPPVDSSNMGSGSSINGPGNIVKKFDTHSNNKVTVGLGNNENGRLKDNKKKNRKGSSKTNNPLNNNNKKRPGPGPGVVPSVPSNLSSINSNGRPIPKPY